MQCSICEGSIKRQQFVCAACTLEAIRGKSELYAKLLKKRNELKERLEKEILNDQQQLTVLQRNVRNQKEKNRLLKEYIKQIQHENTNQEQLCKKMFDDQTKRKEEFEQARNSLRNIIQENRGSMETQYQSLKGFNSEKFEKMRRTSCFSLFQSFPISTNSGKIITQAKSTNKLVLHIQCDPSSKELYFLQRDFKLPISVISEGFDFIEAIAKFDTFDYYTQKALNEVGSFKDTWPSSQNLSAMLGYLVLVIQQLSQLLEIPVPYEMEYRGCKSIIYDLIGSELRRKRIAEQLEKQDMNDSNISSASIVYSESDLYTTIVEPKFKTYPLFDPGSNTLGSPASGESFPTNLLLSTESLTSSSSDILSSSSNSREGFVRAVELLNDNVIAICHGQGIMVSEINSRNLMHNLLTLYHYENIGCVGPFLYTSKVKKTEEIADISVFKTNINENHYFIVNEVAQEVIMKKIIVHSKETISTQTIKNNSVISGHLKEDYLDKDDE